MKLYPLFCCCICKSLSYDCDELSVNPESLEHIHCYHTALMVAQEKMPLENYKGYVEDWALEFQRSHNERNKKYDYELLLCNNCGQMTNHEQVRQGFRCLKCKKN